MLAQTCEMAKQLQQCVLDEIRVVTSFGFEIVGQVRCMIDRL